MTLETVIFKLLPEPGCVLFQISQFSPCSFCAMLTRLRVMQEALLSLETSSYCYVSGIVIHSSSYPWQPCFCLVGQVSK